MPITTDSSFERLADWEDMLSAYEMDDLEGVVPEPDDDAVPAHIELTRADIAALAGA